MTKAVLLLAALLLPACFAGDPAAGSCDDLYDRFSAAAATVDRSCQTVADCAAVGGQSADTCDCTPALVDVAVNRAAYQGSTAADLSRRFREQCADDPTAPAICDNAPPEIACVDNLCRIELTSCLDFGVDAGL